MSESDQILERLTALKALGVTLELGSPAAEAMIERIAQYLKESKRTVDSLTIAELRNLTASSSI